MRIKSLVIGYVFAIALFLFAQRHPVTAHPSGFRAVVDLTYASDATTPDTASSHPSASRQFDGKRWASQKFETRLDAPATLSKTLWTVGQIPPERLIAPLVILDVRNNVKRNADYQISATDIANWEHMHGEIPVGSVVMALTKSVKQTEYPSIAAHSAGYSADAAKFLVEGRNAVGLGIDSRLSKDRPVYKYTLSHSTYLLENVAELDRAPSVGGIVMVAPAKLPNRNDAPVRILALAR